MVAGEGGGSPGEGIQACWGGLVLDCVILIPKRQRGILMGDFRPERGVYLGGNLVRMHLE